MAFDAEDSSAYPTDFVRSWINLASSQMWPADANTIPLPSGTVPGAQSSFSSQDWNTEHVLADFNHRKLSLVSPTGSILSDEFATSPMTPQDSGRWYSHTPAIVDPTSLSTAHLQYDMLSRCQQPDRENLWLPQHYDLPLLPAAEPRTPVRYSGRGEIDSQCSAYLLTSYTNDPTISRQIFADPLDTNSYQQLDCLPTGCSDATVWFESRTIAPKATLQCLVSSSPTTKMDVSSPIKPETVRRPEMSPDSSPFPLPVSHMVPSQKSETSVETECQSSNFATQPVLVRRSCRAAHRPRDRKFSVSSNYQPRKRVNSMVYDSVIPQNSFACTVPGCLVKGTGGPKRFKRQEHRKRHELTVHEREKKYFCWVPDCLKGFTRTDNLKSHIQNTHGKNNPAQRNRYVATLDSSNECYDPHWQGRLTDDGYPLTDKVVVHRCCEVGCEKIFFLEEKLKVHLEQHHGRKTLSLHSFYDSEAGEANDLADAESSCRKIKLESLPTP